MLVDDGTLNGTGAEIILRRRFEDFLKQLQLENSSRKIPMVCLVLGGGKTTLQSVLYNITSIPPAPIVAFAGSGRAADILSMAIKQDSNKK